VGLKHIDVDPTSNNSVFQTNPRGVEAGLEAEQQELLEEFQTNPRGVEAAGSSEVSVPLRSFQTNPRGVEARRSPRR